MKIPTPEEIAHGMQGGFMTDRDITCATAGARAMAEAIAEAMDQEYSKAYEFQRPTIEIMRNAICAAIAAKEENH